jgi:hypothetical protein
MVDLFPSISILAANRNRFGISVITGFPMSSGRVSLLTENYRRLEKRFEYKYPGCLNTGFDVPLCSKLVKGTWVH